MQKVIGIGESVWDIIFHDGRVQRAVAGGSVFNGMVSLSRCGVPALFVSELGKDEVGRLIRLFMEENGMTAEYIDFFEGGRSPVSLAFLDERREAHYSFYKDFPKKRLSAPFPVAEEGDVLLFGSYFAVQPEVRSRVRELLQAAGDSGATLYYDINFRRVHGAEREDLWPSFEENFALASLIRCSDEDWEVLFPQKSVEEVYAHYFSEKGKTLIVTQGEGPIRLKTPRLEKYYPVEAVQPVSTVGAGDNFNAGLVYEIVRGGICAASLPALPEAQWDRLIVAGQKFAAAACLSLDNYVPQNFII
jgi:fructokinase